ncbi:zinc-finger domain-containing protein [Anaplasma phagocytophilum]|nr:zinc-finger domain-containing protein [Anaplasma phagocytophilum]
MPLMSSAEEKGEKILSCNGNNGDDNFFGHPKVYLKVAPDEERPCPYCGKILK